MRNFSPASSARSNLSSYESKYLFGSSEDLSNNSRSSRSMSFTKNKMLIDCLQNVMEVAQERVKDNYASIKHRLYKFFLSHIIPSDPSA